ncbi:aminodeoxychorismate synthase component I [Bradyrhizobium sp. BRP14]|nr:aminodeoxychorismate synthase component I [Bradyrhizobium sp. BRP14]
MNKPAKDEGLYVPTVPQGSFDLLQQKVPWDGDTEPLFLTFFTKHENVFWLDSNMRVPGLSRYSFMGALQGPHSRLIRYDVLRETLYISTAASTEPHQQTGDLFRFLAQTLSGIRLNQPADFTSPFAGGYCGYFGYELKRQTCRGFAYRPSSPDAMLLFADRFLAMDHELGIISICALAVQSDPVDRHEAKQWINDTRTAIEALPQPTPPPAAAYPGGDPAAAVPVFEIRDGKGNYLSKIKSSLDLINQGETYEVCLTNEIATQYDVDPLHIYRSLRRANPAPYSGFLRFGKLAVSCSSPERFLRVDGEGMVESKPIKGTARRSSDTATDRQLAEELARDEKSRAENLMIVDLLRNDLGRVCQTGTVHVPKLMQVESYKTVHQLVSTIRGQLDPSVPPAECIRACFPGGSMTGAPKIRTMEIIDQLERAARGIYSGSMGYLSLNGQCDLNIVIRTVVSQGNKHSIGCGGAIIALSDPEAEFDEIILKARAPMAAIVEAATGQITREFHWTDRSIEGARTKGNHRMRLATTEDASAITQAVERLLVTLGGVPDFFDAEIAEHACRELLQRGDNGFVVLAEDEQGGLLGIMALSRCSAIRTSKPYGIVQEAWVSDAARNLSLGQEMMRFLQKTAQLTGIDVVEVSIPGRVHPNHDRIRRFYERCDFVPAGERLRWQAAPQL